MITKFFARRELLTHADQSGLVKVQFDANREWFNSNFIIRTLGIETTMLGIFNVLSNLHSQLTNEWANNKQ